MLISKIKIIIYWLVLLYFSSIWFNTTYWSDFYSIDNNSIQCINKHGVNRAIENLSWVGIFVPTRSPLEWSNFLSNKPSNVFEYITSWNLWIWWNCNSTTTWSNWSECSVSCWWWTQTRTCTNVNWVQTRNVTCNLSDWRIQLDSCCTWTKPSTTQSCAWSCAWGSIETRTCNIDLCINYCTLNSTLNCVLHEPTPTYTYSWNIWSWSECSTSCWWWIQTRTVTCQRNDSVTVSDSNCSGMKPATSQTCNTNLCINNNEYCRLSVIYSINNHNFPYFYWPEWHISKTWNISYNSNWCNFYSEEEVSSSCPSWVPTYPDSSTRYGVVNWNFNINWHLCSISTWYTKIERWWSSCDYDEFVEVICIR